MGKGISCVLSPLLFFGFLGAAGAGLPPVSFPAVTTRINAPDLPPPGQRARMLAENGGHEAADLQRIEDMATGNSPCLSIALKSIRFNEPRSLFEGQVRAALKTAHILSHYFLTASNDSEVEALLMSLVRANVESDVSLSGSSIVLDSDPPLIVLFGRGSSNLLDRWAGNEWYWTLRARNYSDLLSQVVNGSDLTVSVEHGFWTAPYIDCNWTTIWHVTFGAPFFARNAVDDFTFKGVVSVSMSLSNVDINHCEEASSPSSAFTSQNHCHSSTQCVPVPGKGFRRGSYRCYCKPNYYPASIEAQRRGQDYYEGIAVEEAHVENILTQNNKLSTHFQCLPCRIGCDTCLGDQPCYVEYNLMIRSLVLCLQSFCSTIVIILMVVVVILRKTRIFSAAMWVMLETILLGALFLYQTVIIRYFEPSVLTCMLEPWFRGLGFAICYGAITLKIYRILAEFQTRKAHRVCVRDKDLLKYLMAIITVVIGYLLAWTAVIIDNMNEGYSVLAHERTSMGMKYVICRALWWDYVTEVGELLFLLFGVFLTYKVRNAKSDCFHEKETLAWSIYVEALVSLLMYTIRHVVWSNLQPDYIYLLYFLRCQCTVSIILLFIFAPKLWYHARPPEIADFSGRQPSSCGDVRPETLKLHEAITSNGEVDFTDINISEMDPEDIRVELRRVYTQLQVLRNLTMRKGNPHISRRRGGRKGTHRRFSLQTFHHRHKHCHEHETEVSKTPEESTASAEGATIGEERAGTPTPTPTVSFRDGPKGRGPD